MYVVKKNKQVEKFSFLQMARTQSVQPNYLPTGPKRDKDPESDVTRAVSKIHNNCSRLLQVKITLNPNRGQLAHIQNKEAHQTLDGSVPESGNNVLNTLAQAFKFSVVDHANKVAD